MKIAVVGGGSTYTPELVKGLMEINDCVKIENVTFLDVKEAEEKFNVVFEFVKRMVKDKFKIEKTFDPKVAFDGADYIVFQFRPGMLSARINDEEIPLKYGLIGQETTGIGGFSAALRAFPLIEKYIELVEKYSKAFVINFTNPSGHITEFVLNYLKFDRFVGLCNIPINLLKNLSELIGCKIEDLFVKYYGLNHLTFLEKIFAKNEDVTQKIFQLLKMHLANVPGDFPADLIEILELYPSPYLRYYLFEKEMVEKLKKEGTRAKKVEKIEKDLLKLYESSDSIPQQLMLRGGSMYSTAAANLIKDLATNAGTIHIVNTKNNGAVTNIPNDYVLEIPCYVKANRVFPVSLGEADEFAVGLIHIVKMYERLTIEAYLYRSRKKALKALLLHPLGPGWQEAPKILDDILKANEKFIDLS
ncbi:6-phospho-beta-glucosidase [Pseudothermotoga thermarum]|uniref:6-phospho-beta-glucosidase n=1 Tax=Pseudothermotoga thermarum DSM 5069 TaxID=688269 RepID=F7YW50_9THEM|nr:6-phospho-beta-glucosidase [Pseudothermotoga thermarum]AEH50539.1 6-phospho-beta-glucosidase [Pseudothermotoga thermarum DSM 5069]